MINNCSGNLHKYDRSRNVFAKRKLGKLSSKQHFLTTIKTIDYTELDEKSDRRLMQSYYFAALNKKMWNEGDGWGIAAMQVH